LDQPRPSSPVSFRKSAYMATVVSWRAI